MGRAQPWKQPLNSQGTKPQDFTSFSQSQPAPAVGRVTPATGTAWHGKTLGNASPKSPRRTQKSLESGAEHPKVSQEMELWVNTRMGRVMLALHPKEG